MKCNKGMKSAVSITRSSCLCSAYVAITCSVPITAGYKLSHMGRAMAQAVRRRPLTAEARVRVRVNPCGICGGQSGTGTGFSPGSSVSPVNIIPLGAAVQRRFSPSKINQSINQSTISHEIFHGSPHSVQQMSDLLYTVDFCVQTLPIHDHQLISFHKLCS
jgi:hypothetical protein